RFGDNQRKMQAQFGIRRERHQLRLWRETYRFDLHGVGAERDVIEAEFTGGVADGALRPFGAVGPDRHLCALNRPVLRIVNQTGNGAEDRCANLCRNEEHEYAELPTSSHFFSQGDPRSIGKSASSTRAVKDQRSSW